MREDNSFDVLPMTIGFLIVGALFIFVGYCHGRKTKRVDVQVEQPAGIELDPVLPSPDEMRERMREKFDAEMAECIKRRPERMAKIVGKIEAAAEVGDWSCKVGTLGLGPDRDFYRDWLEHGGYRIEMDLIDWRVSWKED